MAAALSWHAPPARLGVQATEFHLVLSRASVKAGVVEIELQNAGEDPHDLQIVPLDGQGGGGALLTEPRARRTVALNLRAGRYRLWCSVADHRALGMQTLLRVRR